MRPSGRAPDEMRTITIEPNFTRHAEGSVLIGFGDTRVLVTASIEERIPPWLRGKGEGWVTALKLLGERQITLDCDVLQADGGTRTAAISGAWVALRIATNKLLTAGLLEKDPIITQVAAVSCGIYQGNPVLDLDYDEDSAADADANFVLLADGKIAEAQATAEGACYDEEGLLRLLRLARIGCNQIFAAQLKAVQ
jgi:ribonuclease PH